MKKKIIAVIIAHPDDEAFGPSGTMAKYAKEGQDVYLLCATKGEEGENRKKDDLRHIYEIREEELMESAKILGVKQVFFLGFGDGSLSNNIYHTVAKKIIEVLTPLKPDTIITFEPQGVSGHLDHIAISMISSYVFEKLESAKTLMQHCITNVMRNALPSYYIYLPPGYKKTDIDYIEDVSSVWEQKVNAINIHKSQLKDTNKMLNLFKNFPKEEYFLVRQKKRILNKVHE